MKSFGFNFKSLLFASVFVSASAFAEGMNPNSLSTNECSVIRASEQKYNLPFENLFVSMTMVAESCEPERGTQYNCEIALSWLPKKVKLGGDVNFFAKQEKLFGAIADNLRYIINIFYEVAQFRIRLSTEISENDSYIIFWAGNMELFLNETRIGYIPSDDLIEEVKANSELRCFGQVHRLVDSEIRQSRIWMILDTEKTETEMLRDLSQCIVEEFYNVTGVFSDPPGQASIFDEADKSRPGNAFLGDQELLILKLLYALDFPDPKSKKSVAKTVKNVVEASCS